MKRKRNCHASIWYDIQNLAYIFKTPACICKHHWVLLLIATGFLEGLTVELVPAGWLDLENSCSRHVCSGNSGHGNRVDNQSTVLVPFKLLTCNIWVSVGLPRALKEKLWTYFPQLRGHVHNGLISNHKFPCLMIVFWAWWSMKKHNFQVHYALLHASYDGIPCSNGAFQQWPWRPGYMYGSFLCSLNIATLSYRQSWLQQK